MKIRESRFTYDDSDPRCFIMVSSSKACQDLTDELEIAYIVCIEHVTKQLKYYWGVWDNTDQENSIRKIMRTGGDWPEIFKQTKLPEQCSQHITSSKSAEDNDSSDSSMVTLILPGG